MKVNFRQGIARYQTDVGANPTFLQRSTGDGTSIDLVVSPDPTIIVFAHKNANYVFEEVKTVRSAWGPFVGTQTHYLYWDVDLLTAQLTRGSTTLPPIIAGIAPPAPVADQHWFDTQATVMKVWNGSKWVEKIRVFAATYSSSAIIKAPPGFPSSANSWLGTQVGITGDFEVGNIVLDSFFKPLRQSDGSFVTSTTNMSVTSIGTRRVRFETDLISLMANEYIPAFSLVQVQTGRRAILARSTSRMSRVVGLALEDMYAGETSTIVAGGLVRNEQWSWPASSVNRPVFCGPTGEVTLTPAQQGVHQQVGYVYDTDAIYIQVQPAIMLTLAPTPAPPPAPASPVPNFSVIVDERSGTVPHVVNFINTSTGSPTAYEWDFTNDGSVDSTATNPSYTYITPGTYTVRLRATNGSGTNEEVKADFITVLPAAPPGTNTNLEVTLGGPTTVTRGQLFTASVLVRNDGLLTATNALRIIELPDVVVGTTRYQVTASLLPPGSNVTRVGTSNFIELPVIPAMIAGAAVNVTFSVQAPPVDCEVRIEARVSSPEVDSTLSDNSASLTIGVRS